MKQMVLKFGTENLFGNEERLSQRVFNDYARQIIDLMQNNIAVVVVSSGAIAAGRERVTTLGREPLEFTKKELASIGTRHLCALWGDAFQEYGSDVAPILVTYANWKHPSELQSISKSITGCLNKTIIPLINENDVVSDEEIRLMECGISENDRLARMVAELVSADAVLFLTNISYVFDADPRSNPHARGFVEINHASILDHAICKDVSTSNNGRGGIASKVREAVLCQRALPKARIAIARGEQDVITRFASGEHVGTSVGTRMRYYPQN